MPTATAKPPRLSPVQLEALQLIGRGWQVINAAPWGCSLGSPPHREGKLIVRRYLRVGNFTTLARLRGLGLVRGGGNWRSDAVRLTAKGREFLTAHAENQLSNER